MLQEDKTHSFQFGFFISDTGRFLFATVYFLLTLATLHNLPLAETCFGGKVGAKSFLKWVQERIGSQEAKTVQKSFARRGKEK